MATNQQNQVFFRFADCPLPSADPSSFDVLASLIRSAASNADVAAAIGAFAGDINQTDYIKDTALMLVIEHKRVEAIEVLAGRGDVDLERQSALGMTPLHAVGAFNAWVCLAPLLRHFPALNTEALDQYGRTPLVAALAQCSFVSVMQLLGAGADCNVPLSGALVHRVRGSDAGRQCLDTITRMRVSTRHAWMVSCTAVGQHGATPLGPAAHSALLDCMLRDTHRVCIPAEDAEDATHTHVVPSEYAGMIARFL